MSRLNTRTTIIIAFHDMCFILWHSICKLSSFMFTYHLSKRSKAILTEVKNSMKTKNTTILKNAKSKIKETTR